MQAHRLIALHLRDQLSFSFSSKTSSCHSNSSTEKYQGRTDANLPCPVEFQTIYNPSPNPSQPVPPISHLTKLSGPALPTLARGLRSRDPVNVHPPAERYLSTEPFVLSMSILLLKDIDILISHIQRRAGPRQRKRHPGTDPLCCRARHIDRKIHRFVFLL